MTEGRRCQSGADAIKARVRSDAVISMTNHRDIKPSNLSPCPLCEEPMEPPTIDTKTGKPTTTTCPKCGTQRTLTLPVSAGWKVWN